MKAIFWNLVKIRKLKQKCYTSSEVGNFRWGHALICSGLAWILGFNGLLAKEAGGKVWSPIMMAGPRDHYHEARIL